MEVLFYADNCEDKTADVLDEVLKNKQYYKCNARVIRRTGSGGKAGVLNDALKIAHGEYLGVYDADAMPEENALYFLVKKYKKIRNVIWQPLDVIKRVMLNRIF